MLRLWFYLWWWIFYCNLLSSAKVRRECHKCVARNVNGYYSFASIKFVVMSKTRDRRIAIEEWLSHRFFFLHYLSETHCECNNYIGSAVKKKISTRVSRIKCVRPKGYVGVIRRDASSSLVSKFLYLFITDNSYDELFAQILSAV